MNSKYILVTGGAGYIGSIISNFLIKKKFKILVLDNLSTGKKKMINSKIKFLKGDLLNYKILKKKLYKYEITHIIHLASNIDVMESELSPNKYLEDNFNMTRNILKIAKIKKVSYFIFSSTAAVYGEKNNTKVSEKDKPKPESNYGLGKVFCEKIIKKECKLNKINFMILRFFNVVGADLDNLSGPIKRGSLFKNLSKSILKKVSKINVYGKDFKTPDGSGLRDYIDVIDLANIVYLVIKHFDSKKNFILNCSYSNPFSVLEIIKLFSKIGNKKINIKFLPKRKGEISKIFADNNQLKKTYKNWKPLKNINESIVSSLKWERFLTKS
tara:strand:- start:12585 stop:13565 length:981 start_codon:yes stop_codon:yes gene_type:complete